MISKVSPAFDLLTGRDEGGAPGSAERKTVPTIGDLTALGTLLGRRGRLRPPAAGAAGGAAGAGAARHRRGRGGAELALDDDLAVAVLDLDLAEVVLARADRRAGGSDRCRPACLRCRSRRSSCRYPCLRHAHCQRRAAASSASHSRARRSRRWFPAPPPRSARHGGSGSRAAGLDRWTSITGTSAGVDRVVQRDGGMREAAGD